MAEAKDLMATIVKTASGMREAVIRKRRWPTKAKTFRTKPDAEDWARRAEDEMVRGLCIEPGTSASEARGVDEVRPADVVVSQTGRVEILGAPVETIRACWTNTGIDFMPRGDFQRAGIPFARE